MDYTNVIYNTDTGRILVCESNGYWTVPPGFALAHFENGMEPVMYLDEDGAACLRPNSMIITEL